MKVLLEIYELFFTCSTKCKLISLFKKIANTVCVLTPRYVIIKHYVAIDGYLM